MLSFAMGVIKDWRDLNALEIIRHPWFISAFLAGGLAQCIKLAQGWFRTRKLDRKFYAAAGGMPSAHTALVTALSVAVGLTNGFDTPEAIMHAVRSAVDEFVRSAEQFDDLTMLCLEYRKKK